MSDLKVKYEVFTRETIGIQKDKVIVDSPILHIYHSEFAQRPRVTDWETVNSILRLVFDPTPHVIGDTQNAIRACLQLLNYKDALYKKIDPKWENKDPSFQERTPQEMFIPLRKKRISGISKMYTNELHDNLKGIFSENFDLRELPPRTCLIHPVGDLQPLCNYPNVKEIFETFDFKITPKYFFDCLFTDDELITLYNNVILLKKGNFFESRETWTEKEKFKYMQNLCYIKTGLLSCVYNKYEINPENIEELSVYLGSLETRKEINTDRLNQMLKKRTTRLRVARPYHYHDREDTSVLPKKDENADK